MLDRFNTNPTQLTGLLSFTAATIACLIAARRSGPRDAPTWKLLGLMNCLFLIETFSELRYQIENIMIAILKANDWYAQRREVQGSIDVLLATAFIFIALFLFWRHAAGRGARVAASMTIAVLAIFTMETVSLHAVDAVFYHPIGPILFIGWLWAIAAAGICLAATQR